MRIPDDKALWLQGTLLEYDGWQWGAASFTFGQIASLPAGSNVRWQFAVDTIFRTLTCDLIGVDVFVECHDRTSFLNAIRSVGPFVSGGGLLWNGTQISGTERLSQLAKANFSASGERSHSLNRAFTDTLEAIFAENGVSWSEKPLLPITPRDAQG
jgi:hypothetical protein